MGYNAFLVLAVLWLISLVWDIKDRFTAREKPEGDKELKKALIKLAAALLSLLAWVIKEVV